MWLDRHFATLKLAAVSVDCCFLHLPQTFLERTHFIIHHKKPQFRLLDWLLFCHQTNINYMSRLATGLISGDLYSFGFTSGKKVASSLKTEMTPSRLSEYKIVHWQGVLRAISKCRCLQCNVDNQCNGVMTECNVISVPINAIPVQCNDWLSSTKLCSIQIQMWEGSVWLTGDRGQTPSLSGCLSHLSPTKLNIKKTIIFLLSWNI